ncbi:hypothetical protein ACJMK2_019007 [Sinanodonta woodiana]|uniref:Inhibitor of apoptosis 2 n=1 Tax=Sinanodonta woodiana TaxID=1069815 RepID=A0ABD3UGL8_SINWO
MAFKNELGSSESCSQLSAKRFNSTGITNLKNIENENKLTFKREMVRAELQSDYYETIPKQVINNKDEHDSIQNQFSSQCFKENDMVRSELQWDDNLCLNTDFVSRPHNKYNYEFCKSENNSNHVSSKTDEMAVHSENTNDKCPKSIPAFLKYQDSDSSVSLRNLSLHASSDSFSDVSSNNDFGIHKDNLQVSNHTDILKTVNDHAISLHESKKKEEENKESSSGIRKNCPLISNSEDNSALKSHPQQPTFDAENKEYKNPGKFVRRKLMPKYPDYESLQSRISSFTGWPARLDQTSRIMAEAGFFYIGVDVNTRCFYCGGGLRNWEHADDPWIEHAKSFPECAYVLDKKGQKFINAVQSKVEQTQLISNNAERCESSSMTKIPSIRRHGTAFELEFDAFEESGSQSGQQETDTELALFLPNEGRESRPGRQSNSATMVESSEMRRLYTVSEDNNPLPIPTGIPLPTTTESDQSSGHPQLERTSLSLHRRLNISNPLQSAVSMTLSCPSLGNQGQDTKAAKSTSSLPQL